jgi:DNA-directed RNA polymerase II subunit RPB2
MEFPDEILSHYFAQKHGRQLVHHQIDSYNYFIKYETQKIIDSFNPCVIEKVLNDRNVRHTIVFKNPCYCPPIMLKQNGNTTEMYPYQARIQNLTYSSTLIVDIDQLVEHFDLKGNKLSEERISSENAIIGSIPIMLYSNLCKLTKYNGDIRDLKECPYDKGGYFIVNGAEKVIVSQEKMADNKMYFFEKKNSKISHIVKIRSIHPKNGLVCEITLLYHKATGEIKIKLPHFKRDDLAIGIVMQMLGVSSEQEFAKIISEDYEQVGFCIEDMRTYFTDGTTIPEIITKFSSNNNKAFMNPDYMNNYIKHYILPHMSTDKVKNKASYLGYATKLLLDFVHGKIQETDRDQYANKRIETPGFLMGQLLRKLYSKLIVDIRQSVLKDITSQNYNVNVKRIIKSSGIENGFKFSLATGNWNLGTTKNTVSMYAVKVGVGQVLKRLNYSDMLSNMRRINTPIDKKGKLVKPRQLNGTSIFTTCPAETPEGQSVGIVKNMSLITSMTTESDDQPIINLLLKRFKIELLEENSYTFGDAKVLVNGKWIGQTGDPMTILEELKDMKRKCLIDFETSISFHFGLGELRIYTDGGRCYHPVLRVGPGNKLLWNGEKVKEFKDYIRNGWIEYLDVEEMENAMIAMNVKDLDNQMVRYTHCEIHPSLMMGICASTIPFSNHNQAPRVAYQSSMGKQAIGHYISNMDERMDAMGHVLMNPQKPLVASKLGKYLHNDVLASGENIIVAYCCYSGQNQEDSVILNQSALDRGLFRSFFYRTYKDEEKSSATPNAEERFCNPSQMKGCKGLKYNSYDHIDSSGIVKNGTRVQGNDILIGKITPISSHTTRQVRDMTYRDNSTTVRHKEGGIVDKIVVTYNNEGHRLVKIRLRQERIPVIGDKFASRIAQKGTVGMVFREEDMPVTETGIVPDLIINSHALPSQPVTGSE